MNTRLTITFAGQLGLLLTSAVYGESSWKFQLSENSAGQDYLPASVETVFNDNSGYGWLAGQIETFAVKVPEGSYDVRICYKSTEAAASGVVRAESRRVMLAPLAESQEVCRRFTVNVRTPRIGSGKRVRLRRARDVDSPQWDDLLTLEFCSGSDSIESFEIRSNDDALTIFLAGDSTVADQNEAPWSGWGQMLPQFFEPTVAVANHAESGRALYSFRSELRLAKVLESCKPGDYVFIQFGHNDQKDDRPGAGPFTTYKENLMQYVRDVRSVEAIPILLTPMERRRWDAGTPRETLTEFAEAVRLVGQESQTPVIDLHSMSLELYGALGEEGSRNAFVHYPANAFPGQPEALKDDTHHNAFGAYELSRCVVEGIRRKVPALADRLRPNISRFEPHNPDHIQQHPALQAIINAN